MYSNVHCTVSKERKPFTKSRLNGAGAGAVDTSPTMERAINMLRAKTTYKK
jgi:hypothetical protein